MTQKSDPNQEVIDEAADLKSRLAETEETLQAIRQYMVDAFVVNRGNSIQVVTLNDSEIPYRMMVESMNEGAVTIIPDGTIFYCNSRFSEMVQTDCENLIGTLFQSLIVPEERRALEASLRKAQRTGLREEFHLQTAQGDRLPVQLSIYKLGTDELSGIAVIATDISELIQAQIKIHTLAAELTRAEQEERQRISQVLHDDLQQRLFAIKAQLSFLNDMQSWKDMLSPDAYSELDQIQASLSESIAITRNLSIDLSPVVLQGKGMAEAMTWLSFRMKEQYGLEVDLDVKEDFNHLENVMRMLLFQSIRELLFNIVKHAGLKQAKVSFDWRDEHPYVIVTDDGKGFDTEAVLNNPKSAHGLLIIKDRLDLLGCQLEVKSKPGSGTRITITLPAQRKSS